MGKLSSPFSSFRRYYSLAPMGGEGWGEGEIRLKSPPLLPPPNLPLAKGEERRICTSVGLRKGKKISPGARALIAGLILTLSCPLALAASDAQSYIQDAQSYLQKSEFNAGIIQLKNALQKDPENIRARFLLGQAYLRTGDGASAEKELRRARDLGLEKKEWLIPLGRAYLLQGKADQIFEEITIDLSDPADIRSSALALQGLAEFAQGRPDDARAKFTQALELVPDNVDALLGMARLVVLDQNLTEAESFADQALEHDPANIEGWVIKGELNRLQGHYPEALTSFEKALGLQPGNVAAQLGRVETYIAQGELDKALVEVDRLRKAQPNYPLANYLRGRILFQKQDFPAAQEALELVIRSAPGHLPSQLLLGAINYAQDNLAQAQNYLSRFVNAQPAHLPARKLLAATEMKLRNPQRAIELLTSASAQAPEDAQLLALLGSAHLQNRDFVKGSEYLQKAAEIAPDVSAIRAQLGLSHLASGETNQAVTELESAVDLGQGLMQADLLLILAHLQQQDFDKAIAAATKLVEKLPENPISHNLLGVAFMAKDEDEKARKAFEQALELQPNFSTAAMNLARLDLKVGDGKAAEERFHQILKQDDGHLEAMLGLASLAEQAGRSAEVVSWLEKAWERNPNALKAGLPLAQHYLARNENLKAINVARGLQSANPNSPLAVRALGLALLANGDHASALASFRKLTELVPQSPEVWHLVAMAQVKAEDYKAAEQAVDRALAVQGDYLPSLVAKAELQLRDKRFEDALESARDIQGKYPDAGIGHKLEGDVYLQQKLFDEAVGAYRAAFDKSPGSQLALLLGNAQWLAGDQEAAVGSLREWLKAEPKDNQARGQLAMYLQEMNRQDEAIAEYEKFVEHDPKNVVVLNNLAWLYNEAGNRRAVEYAERAAELASDRPEIADTLGWVLIHNDQAQRGLTLLKQAAVQAPHLPEIRYHLAVAYERVGRKEDARKELQRLLSKHSNLPETQQAEALLKRLQDQ